MAMNRAAAWGDPQPLAADEPRSPYAHFAFQEHKAAPRARSHGACYNPPQGCMLVRSAPGARISVETAASFAEARTDEFGSGDRVVAIQLPHDRVNPNLGKRRDDAASHTGRLWPDEIPMSTAGLPPVFIGIVDDAIAFAHQRFRLPDGGTRFDYLWLQGVPYVGGDVPFGRELVRSEIDRLLGEHRSEAGVYRAVGLIEMGRPTVQHVAQAFSHGTAELDAAAGYRPDDPAGAARPIAAVCLPPEVISDTLGSFAEDYIMQGLDRLLAHLERRRAAASRPVPAVINISLARTGGPKDGTSLLDRYLEQTVQDHRPLRYVLPAGNHRLSRCRARFDARSERALEATWRLPPDDWTPSFLEIWGPPRADKPEAPSLSLGLRLPGSPESISVPDLQMEHYRRLLAGPDKELAWVYRQWIEAPDRSGGRERFTIVTFPTRGSGDASTAPAGDWLIGIEPASDAPLPIDLYIQRDDTIPGFRRRGRQSYFVDAGYRNRLPNGFPRLVDRGERSPIRRAGTISSFATGDVPVVVGARYASSGRTVGYSGAPEPGGRALSRCAAAERSPVVRGMLQAGSTSGSRVAIGGTSVAAALVTRALADEVGPG
jgi:hypothetical protein